MQDVDAAALAVDVRSRARQLWRDAPSHPYCLRVGISSWEGLWCRFEGHDRDVRWLRQWAPSYRREAWRLALADHGIHSEQLAEELGERLVSERHSRHEVFPDAVATLNKLRGDHPLALVTNGASCLQREKLAATGLERYFDVVVISAEFGVSKPDVAIFHHALSRLRADHAGSVMIGDSLSHDITGAHARGLAAIWVNRTGRRPQDRNAECVEVSTLNELPAVLARAEP